MRDLLRNSRVRRRLFADEGSSEEARRDNYTNIVLESIRMDQVKYSKKYNFDFKNEKPLEGRYEWLKINGNFDWKGKKNDREVTDNDDIDKNVKSELPEDCLDMKLLNEATPRISHGEAVLVARKRRMVAELEGDKAVRRKIDFE